MMSFVQWVGAMEKRSVSVGRLLFTPRIYDLVTSVSAQRAWLRAFYSYDVFVLGVWHFLFKLGITSYKEFIGVSGGVPRGVFSLVLLLFTASLVCLLSVQVSPY